MFLHNNHSHNYRIARLSLADLIFVWLYSRFCLFSIVLTSQTTRGWCQPEADILGLVSPCRSPGCRRGNMRPRSHNREPRIEKGSIYGGKQIRRFLFGFRCICLVNYSVVYYWLKKASSCLGMVCKNIVDIVARRRMLTKIWTLDPLFIAEIL